VATVGGQVRQYQITVSPTKLAAYKLPLEAVITAVRKGNNDVGGRLVELSGREYMVRGRGYVKSIADLEKLVLKAEGGTPIQVKDVATVALGPEIRRGVADFNGEGDVVGGIVVMRQGENALGVIERVKAKLEELKPSLPEGVEVVTTYDRSELIGQAITTVRSKLIEEILIVSAVILIFLWHIPSAIVPIVTIPVSVALAFIPMYAMGMGANLMTLAGIAISIGVLVDGAIIEVENAYNKIHHWQKDGSKGDFYKVRLEALLEVGPAVFFSLLVIAVAFMPVFTLVDQEGRLFRPLAISKNLAMAIAAVLAITLDPAMRMLFARIEPYRFKPKALSWLATQAFVGTYHSEERHPISRVLHRMYERPCRFVLRHPRAVIAASLLLVAATVPVYLKLGSEFMPPLNEGTILYMPSAVQPGMSVAEAQAALQLQDKILRTFPEVKSVFGKAGRANTSTDPAPFGMMETTVVLKPEGDWREKPRWYSTWAPGWLKAPLRSFWRDRITEEELKSEMDAALQLPGISNAWTMPIKGRLDMLSTGIRTPIGIKISGSKLPEIERIALETEAALRKLPDTRSVFAERVAGGYFLDFVLKRDQLARYGLSIDDANMMVMTAVGGDEQGVTVEGRERYSINVRYQRDYREDLDALKRVLLPLPRGGQIPMEEIADVLLVSGPSMIRNENGLLAGYVYVDFDTSKVDIGSYVDEAKRAVAAVKVPTGYSLGWSGQYENMLRVRERMKVVLPITIVLIFALLYMNTKSAIKASIVMLAVPFSAIGAVWLMLALGYNVSIAAWVGMIALMGLDAETGVFMLLFLDLSLADRTRRGLMNTRGDLVEGIVHGAVKRLRPKAMTVSAAFMGLLPIMWSTGTGADVMKRIAAPMVGGLLTSFILELLVYPPVYLLWKGKGLPGGPATPAAAVVE
jgi:Cu(I)/Ag(I) efflux system membrane protein CusA/SilA